MPSQTATTLSSNSLTTRSDLLAALNTLLAPLDAYTSPGKARVRIGHTAAHFDDTAVELEGFARRLWGAIPAGDDIDWAPYVEGLANGVNPDHEEYWGDTVNGDQRFVEMAAIGFGLAFIPEKIWNPLSEKARTRLQDWLLTINDRVYPNNNWHFFRVLVNLGLARVGARHSLDSVIYCLDKLEEWYLGDGWYSDGPTQQRDYYITFAIHYYSLIYTRIICSSHFSTSTYDALRQRANLYRERAALMAGHFVHFFDPATGASIPFGRSLTYRFACVGFWGALAFAEVDLPGSLTWGIVKGIVLRNLRWWFARSEEWLNGDETMSIGWAYPNLNMAEAYNSPGSPYWAMKAFIPLAVPESHPFWTSDEQPIPSLPSPHAIPHAHSILVHSAHGHTYALTSGQYANFVMRHSADKYGKLAYSATFGFCVPTGAFGLEQVSPDCTLALSDDADIKSGNGGHWRVRRGPLDAKIVKEDGGEGVAIYARWDAWSDVDVRTWVVPVLDAPENAGKGDWHLRIHRIVTGRALWTCDGSFSTHGNSSTGSRRRLQGWDAINDEGAETHEGGAFVRSSAGTTGICHISHKDGTAPVPRILNLPPNSSLMFPRVLLPAITTKIEPRPEPYWLVSGVFAIPGHSKDDGWRASWHGGKALEVPKWLKDILPSE